MKLAQFKFMGTPNEEIDDTIKANWATGDAFKYKGNSVFPGYRLRIQTFPGVQFNINNSLGWVTVGYDGVYELDLGGQPLITNLKFSSDSLENVINLMNNSKIAYSKEGILVEIFFEGGYA